MTSEAELLSTLRRYWGYDSFRPMQERIVRSLLSGRDACVIMPTGGGKSLCYQLPAALSAERTAVVISPLIALMQDQVAQLAQMGIASAFLNSSLAAGEQSRIVQDACAGKYRLLYLSPERLARADTVAWLQRVPVSFFAIDEAHCISEWGHEFRPDYRHLHSLRVRFPACPIAAFTASATRRVRHDILEQLQLRDPDKYIASFHRPNLRYIVRECSGQTQPGLLLSALKRHSGSNIIVYAPTIARVEETVDYLEEHGIPAVVYHGQMDAATRRNNQERWMSDEVRVLVGTIAFGLGINKAAVRAVIHLSLPKSVEQYYQEAGRAGRDGHPADCVLLWQKRDAGLLAHFIGQIEDIAEKERAWKRYREIRCFVEAESCRHRQICSHFGENPKWTTCGACDVCGCELGWLMPCVTERSGRSGSAPSPASQGWARRPELGKRGKDAGRGAGAAPKAHLGLGSDLDTELRDYLREWRRIAAKGRSVPAYIVMHDTSLDELCQAQPRSLRDLLNVSGFGECKVELYGEQILEALAQFRNGARAIQPSEKKAKPAEETIRLLREGNTFEQIATIRGRQLGTVIAMVADLVERGDLQFQRGWVDGEKQASIEAACQRLGVQRLKSIKEALPPEITFDEIRLVVARLRGENRSDAANGGKARQFSK